MPFALQCLSHTPLRGQVDPSVATQAAATAAIETLAAQLKAFDPEVIFLFAPDHFNGFFYDLMPPFCIGVAGDSIGDYGTSKGKMPVPKDLALACAEAVMDAGVDTAVSYRMQLDHGFAQPLDWLAGGLEHYPVVPIFINSVAPPMPSFTRAQCLGEAVGRFAKGLNKRVLFLASGGLSHNPPVPQIAGAAPDVVERLIAGRNPTAEARAQREARVIQAGRDFASGNSPLHPLNPAWDTAFMQHLADKNFAAITAQNNAYLSEVAGNSTHEVKGWLAANAAMQAATDDQYKVTMLHYAPIPEWIAGFGALYGVQG